MDLLSYVFAITARVPSRQTSSMTGVSRWKKLGSKTCLNAKPNTYPLDIAHA